MSNDWKPRLHFSVEHLGYLLYMTRQTPHGVEFLLPDGTVQLMNEGTASKKQLWLARFEDTSQLRQLIEEAEKQGVTAPSTDHAKGELEATKKHLFDMRAITYKHEGLMFEADVREKPPLGKPR